MPAIKVQSANIEDAYIDDGNTSFNYGSAATLIVGDVAGAKYRALLKPSLSSLPSTAYVVKATLTLYCTAETDATDYSVGAHKALTQWYEGEKDGAAPDSGDDGSTWAERNASGPLSWGAAGGLAGTDYESTATDSVSITAASAAYELDVTADVQAWVNDGDDNYGWWLINAGQATSNSAKTFASAEGLAPAQTPRLTVLYALTGSTVNDQALWVRSQKELAGWLQRRGRNPSTSRWTPTEIYEAINASLMSWQNRVQVPWYFDISLASGTFDYSLPDYIDGPVDLQARRTIWGVISSSESDGWDEVWDDVPGYRIEPGSAGGSTLRMERIPVTVSGRIFWYGHNGQLPTEVPVVSSAGLTDTATYLALKNAPIVSRSGIVKINNEVMSYCGWVNDGGSLILTNLVRGIYGTYPAAHAEDDEVEWCVAVHREDLWEQLHSQVMAYLHLLFLTDGGITEKDTHERMVGYFNNEAKMYWQKFRPLRSPQIRLSQRTRPRMNAGGSKLRHRMGY